VGFYLSFAKDIETEEPLGVYRICQFMNFPKNWFPTKKIPSLKLTANAPEHRPSQKEGHIFRP